MALPEPTRFDRALYAVTAHASLGRLALGQGLGSVVASNENVLLLRHGIGDGVPTGPTLDALTSLITASATLDLNSHDPWLDSLDAEQLALYQSRDLTRPVEGNADRYAYYVPFHHHTALELLQLDERRATWGIYLTTGGLEALAREAFVPAGLTAEQALRAAVRALCGHELFHFLTEVAITSGELAVTAAGGHADHYLAHARSHTPGCCPVEEGLANRNILRVTAAAESDAMRSWMAAGPVGYNQFATYEDERREQEGLRTVLGHARGLPPGDLPALAELAFDVGTQHAALPVVPLHLEVSDGSAYAAGEWNWSLATRPAP